MKKIITILASIACFSLVFSVVYQGPRDTSMPPDLHYTPHTSTLGRHARYMDVIALADVIEDNGPSPGYEVGSIKVRVVNPVYGCTNGQEYVVTKERYWLFQNDYYKGPFNFYPTNNSRIVFTGVMKFPKEIDPWRVLTWKTPAEPEEIMVQTNNPCHFYEFSRSWWYEDYQGGLPYAQLTNLVRVTRFERNWTNYYYLCRDNIPNSSSPRLWQDADFDLGDLMLYASDSQFEFMMNDPLFPDECKEWQIIVRDQFRAGREFPD